MSGPERLLYSMEEAAAMLGVCKKTLRAHCIARDIRFVITGKRTRKFSQGDIDQFIESRRRECPSTSRKRARSGTTTSDSIIYDFTAQRARRIGQAQN